MMNNFIIKREWQHRANPVSAAWRILMDRSSASYLLPRFMILSFVLMAIGCSQLPLRRETTVDQCIKALTRDLSTAPKLYHLTTLDGQKIRLEEFYQQCLQKWPDCVLPEKFYHWKSEVKEIVSQTKRGPVNHKIKAYFNILSTCAPQKIKPGRTHGDVAEFYDEEGVFMGLSVYMGKGLYCPLPFSGYRPKSMREVQSDDSME